MDSMTAINGSYDYRLVTLSVVLALFASYAALDLAGRVTAAQGRMRAIWLSGGTAAMGLGIWAMHHVGMLALGMPMPVFYHLPTVMLSLLAAIVASGIALFVVSRPTMNVWQEIAGSVVMGSGIAAMHYVGMAAMRCSAAIVYDLSIVALSIVLAIVISLVALRLTFRVRDKKRTSRRKIISALVMGSAIPLMHYTGMRAATFHNSHHAMDFTHAIGISTIGVVAISASSFFVLGGAIASSFFDRFIAVQQVDLDAARERELYFHTMAEAVPEIIWTAKPDGADDYFNQRCFDYTGLTFEQSRGAGWTVAVHPDDLALVWRNGETRCAPVTPTTWSIACGGRMESSGGFYAGVIPSAIPREGLSNGSEPVRTSKIRSRTSKFWRSRFWNGPRNWPTPTRGCRRRC
jgi:NO-binding membrane sensor protein with MHYT domain